MCEFFWADKDGVPSSGEGDLSDIIRAAQPAVIQSEPSVWHFPSSSSGGDFGDPFACREDDASFIEDHIPDGDLMEEIKGVISPYDVIRVSDHHPVVENGLGAASSAAASVVPAPLRAPPANKRSMHRKGQTKKVVCIPAPVAAAASSSTSATMAASGRPSNGSEVVPSDLWAWRKYGQKPIKGSPYPRGYYRCSSSKGCSARKQVERSRTDPNMLVITYTSEHNHPWPTHRNTLAGSTRGGHLSKPPSLTSPNPNLNPNLTQTLIPPSHVTVRDELDKMINYNMLRMPLPPSDVLFKQEVEENGASEGIFWGLAMNNLEPVDPVSLILANRGSMEAKRGEESGGKGAVDPFSLF